MDNLRTEDQKVNGSAAKATMAEVVAWAEAQIAKGDMAQDGGKLRITALNAMAEQVAPDEPNDAYSVLTNIDRLTDRWARKNPDGKAETARSYGSRARTTIEAYFRWAAAPANYDPKKVLQKRGDGTSPPKKRTAPQQAAPLPAATPVTRSGERTFPLANGREVAYVLPQGGIDTAEVRRFAFHLWTLANDFDPGQSFGLVRAKED